MSVEFVFALAGLSVVVGYLVDSILSTEERERVAAWAENSWLTLDEVPAEQLVRNASIRFSRLFDLIYGAEFWSLRRVVRSVASTSCALVAMTLLIGPSRTFFGTLPELLSDPSGWNLFVLIFLFVIVAWLNLFVDYFSLAETRMVLTLSYRTRLPVLVLTAIDIGLTVLIFAVGWVGLRLFLHLLGAEFDATARDLLAVAWDAWELFQEEGLDPEGYGLFFFSTFLTSATWFLYVASTVVLRLLLASSRAIKPILLRMSETQKPGQLIGSMLALILVGLYGVVKLFDLLVT